MKHEMSIKTFLILFKVIVASIFFFPDTIAKDVYYSFNAEYTCGAPDGVEVCHILSINGEFPGPTIRAAIGDTVHVNITNNIQTLEATTLHWHGLFQNRSQFQDGPHMVTQCGIPSGSSQNYVFIVNQYGTYWWHSHVTYQYTEGLFGAFIIDSLQEVYGEYYDAELVIILSDWSQLSGQTNSDWFLSPASGGNEPIPFSGLINGHGSYPCNYTTLPCDTKKQQPAVFNVERGKRYRVRIINASAMAVYYFSIQGHTLNVIEVDGVDTVKVALDRIPIAPAQRYSAIVEMNGNEQEYTILAEMSFAMYNFDDPNVNPYPEALIQSVKARLVYTSTKTATSYDTESSSSFSPSTMTRSSTDFFPKEMKLQPYNKILAPNHFDREIGLIVEGVVDSQGVSHLTFNNVTYVVGKVPILVQVLRNEHIPDSAHSFNTGHLEVVQIVLNNHDTGPHPFHLHGHTFWVLGRGATNAGDYDPSRDVLQLNGVRRDTIVVNTQSWIVLRFVTDNPGVWFFHCHINWHLQSGLAATIIEAAEVTRREIEIPLEAKRICSEAGVDLN